MASVSNLSADAKVFVSVLAAVDGIDHPHDVITEVPNTPLPTGLVLVPNLSVEAIVFVPGMPAHRIRHLVPTSLYLQPLLYPTCQLTISANYL